MASPESADSVLARAISELDLSKALDEAKLQAETGMARMRYTREDLLSLRPKNEKHNVEHEVFEVGSPSPDGIMTPPERICPNPPPPTPDTANNENNTHSATEAGKTNGEVDTALSQLPNGDAPKKKKKNKKSSGVNRRAMGNGFEEFYADPPQTPEEYEEECDLYDLSVPFESRIQTCIQRYRGRRKLDETRSNIITKYLMLGGVEATTKAFTGGLDKDTIENSTAAEIAALQASDYVRASGNAKYYDGSNAWVVDFEGVAKGFFSYRIPNMFPIDNQKHVELYAMTIRNFLNYALHHRVCEEYTADVMAARKVCDLAEKELWAIKQLQSKVPGDFNVAASTLYGGHYENVHMGSAAWAVEDPSYQEYATTDQGFEVAEAERIFKTAIAFAGNDDMFLQVMAENVQIVKTATRCFEVVEILRPDLETIEQYKSVKNFRGEVGLVKPLGALKLKYWEGPETTPEDYTDDEDNVVEGKDIIESFWLEDEILQLCYVGLKMEVDVQELSIGLKFFDRVHGLYCSFFTALPNEKMIGWKEPVPNTRPPPTEEDPEVEEKIMDEEAEKLLEEEEELMKDSK